MSKTYRVVEQRMVTIEYEIEAESREAASVLRGNILDEVEIDNYGWDLLKVEEITE